MVSSQGLLAESFLEGTPERPCAVSGRLAGVVEVTVSGALSGSEAAHAWTDSFAGCDASLSPLCALDAEQIYNSCSSRSIKRM